MQWWAIAAGGVGITWWVWWRRRDAVRGFEVWNVREGRLPVTLLADDVGLGKTISAGLKALAKARSEPPQHAGDGVGTDFPYI
ncbi:MAG: hypothetical protein JWN40_2040 [Phycisphaerales bacterium]|nr:hypothetical protein [Phycisphaerales bacterium]